MNNLYAISNLIYNVQNHTLDKLHILNQFLDGNDFYSDKW